MANVSAYAAKNLLDWTLNGAATSTEPATVAIGLANAAPTSIAATELASDSGYTRKTAIFSAAASPAGTCKNATAITFGTFSTTYVVSGIHIWDGIPVSSGNMLWYGTLATTKTVSNGDLLVFAVDALTVSLV